MAFGSFDFTKLNQGNWWDKPTTPSMVEQLLYFGEPEPVGMNKRPTKKQRKAAKKNNLTLLPQNLITFNNENPEIQETMGRMATPLDQAQRQRGEEYDPFKTLKDQYLQSALGKNLYPNTPPSLGMQQELREQGRVEKVDGKEMVKPNLPFLAGTPLESVGELSDIAYQSSEQGGKGVPLTEKQIRKNVGKELHSTIKGLMKRGLTHNEAQNALSFGLATGTPTTDPDALFAQSPKGQIINTVTNPEFQARAIIETDILPPILSSIDQKKDLLNQLVSWEQSGTPGRTPLYGNSDLLDMPYTGNSGMLAAEIAFDEGNIEKKALAEFINRQGKKETLDTQILNAINSGGTPDPGYFQKQGYPFPQLASLVLATLAGGSIRKPEGGGGVFTEEQRQQFLKNIVGSDPFTAGLK